MAAESSPHAVSAMMFAVRLQSRAGLAEPRSSEVLPKGSLRISRLARERCGVEDTERNVLALHHPLVMFVRATNGLCFDTLRPGLFFRSVREARVIRRADIFSHRARRDKEPGKGLNRVSAAARSSDGVTLVKPWDGVGWKVASATRLSLRAMMRCTDDHDGDEYQMRKGYVTCLLCMVLPLRRQNYYLPDFDEVLCRNAKQLSSSTKLYCWERHR